MSFNDETEHVSIITNQQSKHWLSVTGSKECEGGDIGRGKRGLFGMHAELSISNISKTDAI